MLGAIFFLLDWAQLYGQKKQKKFKKKPHPSPGKKKKTFPPPTCVGVGRLTGVRITLTSTPLRLATPFLYSLRSLKRAHAYGTSPNPDVKLNRKRGLIR